MGYRPRIRTSNDAFCFYLYPADTTLGWRVLRKVSLAAGRVKVIEGHWREVFDENMSHIGYQVVASFVNEVELPSRASSSSISVNEILMYAGAAMKDGKSQTADLDEEKRITRRHHKTHKWLPPEDAVECAIAKVNQWPFPASRVDDGKSAPAFGDRAVRVYPKPAGEHAARV